jgi:GNAT superfamily N-acetyltransferase
MQSVDPRHDLSKYVVTLVPPEISVGVPRTDPLDYVSAVIGTVVHGKTIRDAEIVSEFSFQHLRVAWARHDGFALRKLFATSPKYEVIFAHLFDPTTERLSSGTSDGGNRSDVLYLDEMTILPEHRGRGLGGHVLESIAAEYFGMWAMMVLRAVPEPFESGPWSDRVYARQFPASGDAAKKKLRVYWARFGFRPLGKTDFMARDVSVLDAPPTSLRAV